MPNKIKSAKQFRFMEGIAHGMKPHGSGPSKEVASEMLSKESHAKKSMFARKKKRA